MKEETMLVPIKASEELPKKDGKYIVEIAKDIYTSVHFNQGQWLISETIKPLTWLKPIPKKEYDRQVVEGLLPDMDLIKHSCPQNLIKRISCWIQGANFVIHHIKEQMK